MELAKQELQNSLKYHNRQKEENERKIQSNLESNEMLKEAIVKHQEYIDQITRLLKVIED